MSLSQASEVLTAANKLNEVLRAAMNAGPNTEEWTALEAYFAETPDDLSGLPACREQIIDNGAWGGSALGRLVPTALKPTTGTEAA